MDLLQNLSPELKRQLDDSVGIIQLVCGEQNHRPFWAYVSMYPSTYLEYLIKVAQHEQVTIEQYGKVIDKGWGNLPPQDVQERMRVEYDADNGLQDELTKVAEEYMAENPDAFQQKTIN